MTSELQSSDSQLPTSKSSHTAETSGARFLEELESRHKYVLDELDELNSRIEQVLKMYVQGRQENAA